MTTLFRLLADCIVLVHLAFVLFVAFGGFLLFWRKWLIWFHLPAVLWGSWIELADEICPLTPFENMLRAKSGGAIYRTGFIDHYIMPFLYPAPLGRSVQIALGLTCIGFNGIIYWWIFHGKQKGGKNA